MGKPVEVASARPADREVNAGKWGSKGCPGTMWAGMVLEFAFHVCWERCVGVHQRCCVAKGGCAVQIRKGIWVSLGCIGGWGHRSSRVHRWWCG